MDNDQSMELKAGLFVLGVMALFIGVVFILGQEDGAFSSKYVLHTEFADVAGLRSGAEVLVAGMPAGLVSTIDFSDDLADPMVHLSMEIAIDFQERIRGDSVVTIASMGVLGDKYLRVTVGSPEHTALQDGQALTSQPTVELSSLMDRGDSILEGVDTAVGKVVEFLGAESGEELVQTVGATLDELRQVLVGINESQGPLGRLIRDEDAGASMVRAIANLERAAGKLDGVLGEVRSGDGGLHDVIYGDSLTSLVGSLQETASGIDQMINAINEGDGTIHDLLYAEGEASIMAKLEEAANDVTAITGMVRNGEGTIGALVADPTLYEDLRVLIGGAKRNALLRGVVRAAIASGEREEGVRD